MANEHKTLVIVEGGRLEPGFFNQLKKVFGLNLDIYCLKNNIYRLYKRMKELGFHANLKDVLLEVQNTEENKKLLSQNFAFTYLIFDFDPHHTEAYEKDIPIENIVNKNISKLREMAKYFVNETDPTIGKLYINYPMMESFKDCDSFEDTEYLTRMIGLDDIKQYKEKVSHRKMANVRIDRYSKNDFINLTRQNAKKLFKICQGSDETMDYKAYISRSNQSIVLQRQNDFVISLRKIAVLNTSVFFTLDYYGNKDGFYDDTMKDK